MKILISGAGIAGPTLAFWLKKYGHEPVIVERAPSFRGNGYVIDFWGLGFDVAERMGLLPELRRRGYMVKEVRIVNKAGDRAGGFFADVFGQLTDNRYLSLARGELAKAIYELVEPSIETIFGDQITKVEQAPDAAHVSFKNCGPRSFDLVIGTDGLHSGLRELMFGPVSQFEKYLGYKVAAFEARGYPKVSDDVYVMFTDPGRQIARFTLKDGRTLFLFVYRDANPDFAHGLDAHKEDLHRAFDGCGWESAEILKLVDQTDELYLDRVSQIHMNSWVKDRVCLIGDAAFCVSLLAGYGSALAMASAYSLAGELHVANGDYKRAFAAYEQRFRPYIAKKQKAAERFAGSFVPKTTFGLFARNQISRLLNIRLVAELALARDLRDTLSLPVYETTA